MAVTPTQAGASERAEHHAQEAERLLTGKLGLITNYVKAQAHATLAVYYATKRSADG
jgi:hypothetical protein